MDRPVRRTPKKKDPDFVIESPLNRRSSKHIERRPPGPEKVSLTRSTPRLSTGKVGSRRASARLSVDSQSSSDGAKTRVKPESSASGAVESPGPKATKSGRGGLRRVSCNVNQKTKKTRSTITPNIASVEDVKTPDDGKIHNEAEWQNETLDISMKTSVGEDDDDAEVSFKITRSPEVVMESLSETIKEISKQSTSKYSCGDSFTTEGGNKQKILQESESSVKSTEKLEGFVGEGSANAVGNAQGDWFENRGSCGRSDAQSKSRASSAREGGSISEVGMPSQSVLQLHKTTSKYIKSVNMNPVIKIQQLDPAEYRHLASARQSCRLSPLKSLANERAKIDGSKVKIMLERCDVLPAKPKIATEKAKKSQEPHVKGQTVKSVGQPVKTRVQLVKTKGQLINTAEHLITKEKPVKVKGHQVKTALQPVKTKDQLVKMPEQHVKTTGRLVRTTGESGRPSGQPVKRRKHRDVFSSYLKKKYYVKRQVGCKNAGDIKVSTKGERRSPVSTNVPKEATRVSPRKKKRSEIFAAYMARRTNASKKLKSALKDKSGNKVKGRREDDRDARSEGRLSGDDLLKKIKEEVDDQGLYGRPPSEWSSNFDGMCDYIAAEEERVTMEAKHHMGEIGQITLAPSPATSIASVSYANPDFVEQSYQGYLNENICDKIDNVHGAVSIDFNGEIGTISLALQSDDASSEQPDNVMEMSYEDFISQDVTDLKKSPTTSKLKEKNKLTPPKRRKGKTDAKAGGKQSPPEGRKRKREGVPSGGNKKQRCSLSGRAKVGASSAAKLKGKKLLKQAQMTKKKTGKNAPTKKPLSNQRGCIKCETKQCVTGLVEGCAGSGDSARWYHISNGEHYCNKCFEFVYRPERNKGGRNNNYLEWRTKWEKNSNRNGSIRIFMIDQILPFWAQCSKCQKWREVPRGVKVSAKFNKNFTCQKIFKGKAGVDPCSKREDPRIKLVRQPNWFADSSGLLILTESAAAPFLVNYPPDDVGLSAFTYKRPKGISSNKENEGKFLEDDKHSDVDSDFDEGLQDPSIEGISDFLRPFHIPGGVLRAGTTAADKMDDDEKSAFPHYVSTPSTQKIYLTLRNLALSLWNLNVKEWLTKGTCAHHIICRGLIRIYCIDLLEEILSYLTVKGMINYGLVKPPHQLRVISNAAKMEHVLVIGAGPAGLSVAHQLHRFGIKVTILEAQSRIGGRVWDDTFAGTVIGRGAQLLNGCLNNPFAVMCQQLNIQTRDMRESCLLIMESGQVVSPAVDNKIDYYFDQMLESVAEWRDGMRLTHDVSLLEKLEEMHNNFVAESGITFTEDEEAIIQFHYSNLEYALGQDLSLISALNWDHNEVFSQFCGPHVIMEEGYSSILRKLAEKLDIKLNVKVEEIQYSESRIKVVDAEGHEFKGSKVVVTVPLKVLQNNSIRFQPPLPKIKQKAIRSVGAGAVEKVALAFPSRFWNKKVPNADYFGHVPACHEERGLFSVFYDLSPKSNPQEECVLVTFISGGAVDLVKDKSDTEIVELCCEKLRKMFPEEIIPPPTKSFVTHWVQNPNAGMAYSYLGVGTSADLYDKLSEEVDDRLFFAGEATNRQFPQSVTGAYLSGVREAEKILHSLAR